MIAPFTRNLLQWNQKENRRSMPWKNIKDPYKIWLSEIILQQTRVEQGKAYYEKFIHEFPTLNDLARASEKKLFKLWEGLGYYSRCRNLMATARKISRESEGRFPATYEEIAALKGVGPYTAAAIASFAYNLPYPVVDGNVQRILSRYFGVRTRMDDAAGKKFYFRLAGSLLPEGQAGRYNQAIMDFGAMICKPRNPLCKDCVQRKECVAFRNNWVDQLPEKKKKPEKKLRHFYYFILETADDRLYIRKRTSSDIWANLYEFPLAEAKAGPDDNPGELRKALRQFLGARIKATAKATATYRQELTHQTIVAHFFRIRIKGPLPDMKGYSLVSRKQIRYYPFPRLISRYIGDSSLAKGESTEG